MGRKRRITFDQEAEDELFEALRVPSISGITFSGGDPLFPNNRSEIFRLIKRLNQNFQKRLYGFIQVILGKISVI